MASQDSFKLLMGLIVLAPLILLGAVTLIHILINSKKDGKHGKR